MRWDADPNVTVDITYEEHRAGQGVEHNAYGTDRPCNFFFAALQGQPPSRTAYWRPLVLGYPNPYRVTFRAYPVVNGVRQQPVVRTVIIN